MGKSTKRKIAEAEEKYHVPYLRLVQSKKVHAQKKLEIFNPAQGIRAYLDLYAIRPIDKFVSKTKSSNPDTLVMELVKYAFNKYPTPKFLDSVWTSKSTNERKDGKDFKEWYIALATGQSLYKEHQRLSNQARDTFFLHLSLFLKCRRSLVVRCNARYGYSNFHGAKGGHNQYFPTSSN